jgi:chemotaxis protein methyltransferase CheR
MIAKGRALTLSPRLRAQFLKCVDREFGIRGSDYGASRLDEAISHILPRTHCATPDELLKTFDPANQPNWLYDLVEYLTVGETYFFRDPAQMAALRGTILPDLMRRHSADRRLRLWSAGCSTGEETYTLAILLLEKGVTAAWDVLLVGTDVNRESLRVAREGRYPAWSFRATPDEKRECYFEPVNKGWRLMEPVRRMARFAWMNLGAEALTPPSTDLDLAVCRNVTIYFDEAATQRLYRALVGALSPGGWLMLGPSDPVPVDRDGLERFDLSDAVLWRRVTPSKTVTAPLVRPKPATKALVPIAAALAELVTGDGHTELEAGLLALEVGSSSSALEWLRRATFHDPFSAVAQFALGCACLGVGNLAHARVALVHARRLLAPLPSDGFVPGTDELVVETLRQTIQTYLEGDHA